MVKTEMLSLYIKKLSHPIKEIRERSLQLLIAKLKLGWEFDDELSGTRQLLEGLITWFQSPQPSLQRDVLQLLLTTIKTKAGTYICKEFGIPSILSDLSKVKNKIDADTLEIFDDIIETLKFMNTVVSDTNVAITRLTLQDVASSDSEEVSSCGYYNLGPNFQSSKETSISNDSDLNKHRNTNVVDSIRILLFPWVDLCHSDKKTLLLVEDALRLLKSTRRCCRFIRDVFLRDFPPEIFLNRPEIIKRLITISDGTNGGRPGEALFVLLHITQALHMRILQLSSADLIHKSTKISEEYKEIDEDLNLELQEITGDCNPSTPQEEDDLVTLKQLPIPVFALDTLHMVLSILARSVVLFEPDDKTDFLDLKELNTCLNLVDILVTLLLDSVNPSFWNMDHTAKIYRDISHKSCMAMRLLGDLLLKYRKSYCEDPDRCHHRLASLRLMMSAEKLLHWALDSALPPTSLVNAMQLAQLDPAVQLFYPQLSKNIDVILENTRTVVNQEYRSKYRELKKLFASMDEAILFVRNKKSHTSKTIFSRIKKSLPVLELLQNENFLYDISDILLKKTKDIDMNDSDWSEARSLALCLMAHNLKWVQTTFYKLMVDMVKSILVGDDNYLSENEKCLTLLCDVGILTEICCHGLSSSVSEVEQNASEIMLYLLRGRLILSESCWWRLLASLLPVLPLLHVYAAHETQLGKAICKSLERDIAECMGVSMVEVLTGLVRLLFVRCLAVQLDAAHTICQMLDDERYLPPKESLRADILLSALRRIQPQDFNLDLTSSPTKTLQTGGLMQMLDVLKQDIMLDEEGEFIARNTIHPSLEPSLRRSTLQQLAVMMRQQDLHHMFVQSDGIKVIIATLRMSLMVDDYLAFPECALSCVSILNSICFASRHELCKIPDLSAFLIRVILVFPANDSSVLMAAQILATVSWAGFALQELDSSRHRIPALPLSVTQRTTLPFNVHSYWNTSPNAEHSYIEWLLTEEEWRTAIRVRWWCANSGSPKLLASAPPAAPVALKPTTRDIVCLKTACPLFSCTKALQNLQNATTHKQVIDALNMLESYVYLVSLANVNKKEFSSLPWNHTNRFLCSPPASSRDITLLCSLLQFVIAYMDNVPNTEGTMSWIKSAFIGNDANIISLLSRTELYPQQTTQESIEIIQLHILIVKVLIRCIVLLEHEQYDSNRLESLIKILLSCLDKINLKDFHMLGYLNELMRCIRYALNLHCCKLSEESIIQCIRLLTRTLTGCASGGGCKGQACRLDATLSLLALLKQIHIEGIPVQRWSELFNSDVISVMVKSSSGGRAELRAAALYVIAALAYYAQMQPHLLQAIQESSLSEFATRIFANNGEANVVRTASASILVAVASRASSRSDILECDVLSQLNENNFVQNCIEILIDFFEAKEYKRSFHPNISVSLLERRSEFEVRAQKGGDVFVSPSHIDAEDSPPPSPNLIISIADALHNIGAFTNCPIQHWNEQGLFRLVFRCSSWSSDSVRSTHQVRAATCRVLLAVSSHKCVRVSLAATKDCLLGLINSLTPFNEDDYNAESIEARKQGLCLLAALLVERTAVDNVWSHLRDTSSVDLFHLVLQCLENDDTDLQDAALYCLTQLALSMTSKSQRDKSKSTPCTQLYDNLQSPHLTGHSASSGAGDSARGVHCQPEFICEEICKALIQLYNNLSSKNKKYQCSQDDRWVRVCSCLSAVLSVSARTRSYSVHRTFPRELLASLQAVRDHLSVIGKPADLIRNANNSPVLHTLYWILTVIDCNMVECLSAKESFVDENIVISVNRLWPWCMMTEQLRHAVIHLLYTFTNNCPKAWSGACTCVCNRTLCGEVCAVVSREAALLTAPRTHTPLLLALNTLTRLAHHHHCRAIILKSEALPSMHRLCVRARVRAAGAAGAAWARLCECVCRHAEGGAALLSSRAPPAALPAPARALLLPAIAHAAHHHRQTFLQSPDLLELLCDTLLAGDTSEIVSAARAIWALAANHHKAKLVLRSAGAASAVYSTLQRLQKLNRDGDMQKAIQLLIYTNTVLQNP